MNKSNITSAWKTEAANDTYALQCADIKTPDGYEHADGAYRVVLVATGKPAKSGKGGTVPFWGECAWMDGQRLYSDLTVQANRRQAW